MARPPKVIIEPNPKGPGWKVAVEGKPAPVAVTKTKAEAERPAREQLDKLGGGEPERRKLDGTIQDARTIPPRKENRRSPG